MKKMVFDGKIYNVFDNDEFMKLASIRQNLEDEILNLKTCRDTLAFAGDDANVIEMVHSNIVDAVAACEELMDEFYKTLHARKQPK